MKISKLEQINMFDIQFMMIYRNAKGQEICRKEKRAPFPEKLINETIKKSGTLKKMGVQQVTIKDKKGNVNEISLEELK